MSALPDTSTENTALDRIIDQLDEPGLKLFGQMMTDGLDARFAAAASEQGLVDLVRQSYDVHATRPNGHHKIAVRRAEGLGSDGEARTVIDIVNDDMPFLVDSTIGELQAHGHNVYLIQHPILKVERSSSGVRERIVGPGDGNWGDGLQESHIVAIVGPMTDDAASALHDALDQVMRQVRLAVTDWRAILRRFGDSLKELERNPPQVAPGIINESLEFCQWLIDGQFTFLGLREYELVGNLATGHLQPVEGSGLGILRDASLEVLSNAGKPLELTPEIRKRMFAAHPLIITKSDITSNIHRRAQMDFIGLKSYGPDGNQTGELRIVGLFTSQAYTERPVQIPLLRQKVDAVLRQTGIAPGSHDGKALINVLENFPRDELFRISTERLARWARDIVDLDMRPRVSVFARPDRFDRFVSVLVYVPRDRFSTPIRLQIGDALCRAYAGEIASYTPFFPEAALIRVHYIIKRNVDVPQREVDEAALEAEIAEIAQMWDHRLETKMDRAGPEIRLLKSKYARAFSPAYSETYPVSRALEDIARIERLDPGGAVAVDFYRTDDAPDGQIRSIVHRFDEPIPLSERVPVLENFGFRSIDEQSYRIAPQFPDGKRQVALHDMVLRTADGAPIALDQVDQRLEEAFVAVNQRRADNDPFNRLIVALGANWREVLMLRAFAAYMRQIRSPYGMKYVSDTLVRHPQIARRLIELFHARFDPGNGLDEQQRIAEQDRLRQTIEEELVAVPSLGEDQILRTYLQLMAATLRTNFYRERPGEDATGTVSFKFAPRDLAMVPEPRPYREIWVYSPRVEGVHLRFGPIARGGLRWSDRAQDFRTEVLGLCKAQQVKNTVIVPEGAKGGFYPKFLPSDGDREAVMAEAVASYRLFISSLLEITDNLVDGNIVAPDNVVRYDDDDPYLVVAADKGTATFSDYANEISTEAGFWLGDAFASGGSAGYDHKKMGITARGAWESVKRHFREMDIDIQTTPFSAIGVGDMSGDVFGNGMLLSEQTRLIAAFDHRDIFVDPDPDPATTFVERKRLFDLGRSSWKDYDTSKISAGGGVFARDAKWIDVSPQIKQLFGLDQDRVTPVELMRAILQSDADLLWFGGIGTYVRAPFETDGDVGDHTNDAIRITADQLHVKVVGEGANLGLTQFARIAFAQGGGRVNTDFIDNSAGVNSSDKEVNVKIAVGSAVRDGRLDMAARNDLLASMTDDVALDCLRNNYQQSLAISLAERRGIRDETLLQRLIRQLEDGNYVRRDLEQLPSDETIANRVAAGQSFTRPEIAVLLSWAKIELTEALIQTDVADDPVNETLLTEYFPPALQERYRADLLDHRLRREIIITRIANSMVNRAGPAMLVRLKDATGRETEDIAASFMATRTVYDLPPLWAAIDDLDNKLSGAVQLDLYAQTQGLLLDQTAELLRLSGAQPISNFVNAYKPGVEAVSAGLEEILTPNQHERYRQHIEHFTARGVPQEVAAGIARLEPLKLAPAAAKLADFTGKPVEEAARTLYGALDYFRIDDLQTRAADLKLTDYFDRLALTGAFGTLKAAGRSLASKFLTDGHAGNASADLDAWVAAIGGGERAAKRLVDEVAASPDFTISRLAVAAAQIRELTSES